MQNVENSRKKYSAKGERGSFHILRTAVVDRSHSFCSPLLIDTVQGKTLKWSALHSQESAIDSCNGTLEASH